MRGNPSCLDLTLQPLPYMTISATCRVCGADFSNQRHKIDQIYCTRACYRRAQSARKSQLYAINRREAIDKVIANRKKRQDVTTTRPQTTNCEACHTECTTVWDHNHVTGKFRGWLCRGCNLALGHLQDSHARCLALADYIAKTNI